MDWGAYAKHIAKGFSNQADNMGLGMLSKEMVMGMASNPITVYSCDACKSSNG